MKCRCLDCNIVYENEKQLENGELIEIACPSCGSWDLEKPFVEKNLKELNFKIKSPRRILHD